MLTGIQTHADKGKTGPVFYGWYILAVCFLCFFAADAFGWYTFGLFIGPISREMGWSTTMLTGAMTLRILMSGFSGPFVGPIADSKHGARILMSLGVLLAGGIPLAVSRVDALWEFYLFYGGIGALGVIGFGGLVTNAVIAKWFVRKRGRAMGIAAMGVSVAGLVFVPLVHSLISRLGWRNTLVVVGLIVWGLTFLPVVLFVRGRPEDMGLRPDGVVSDGGSGGLEENTGVDVASGLEEIWTPREALRNRSLWLLLIGFQIAGVAMSGTFIHFYPAIEAMGFSSDVAAGATTVVAFFCGLVKVPWGMLAERVHVRYCITACYTGCALSLLILLNAHSVPLVFVYAVAYGATLGGDMVLRELAWANYYGRTFLGTIRGMVMPVNLVSSAGGPLFAAWMKDVTGDYRLAYLTFLVAMILGAGFIFLAKPPMKGTLAARLS